MRITTATIKDYLELCKPRVVLLMILTSMVGMCLASDGSLSYPIFILGNLGIALIAGAAATLNHIADQHIDRLMRRTERRPIVSGKISVPASVWFAAIIGAMGFSILFFCVNALTAYLTLLSLVGYAAIYTLYLKHATPQNIVIGGVAGAMPPLLGWTAVTNQVTAESLLLVLIIYVWTPPHFWSLSINRLEDYKKANVPMLPLTHGVPYTKLNILLYTIILSCVTLFPYLIDMSHNIYLFGVTIANIIFLWHALRLYLNPTKEYALKTFWYSIYYLGILFVLLLIDHYYYLN